MRIREFMRDHVRFIVFYLAFSVLTSVSLLLDSSVSVSPESIIYINLLGGVLFAAYLSWEYLSRRENLKLLKLLIKQNNGSLPTSLPVPITKEQGIYFDLLIKLHENYSKDLNKLQQDKSEIADFMNYWVHEIKTPIAGSRLVLQNSLNKSKDELVDIMDEKIEAIDNYVEKALYHSRLDSFSQDYLIVEVNAGDLVRGIVSKHARSFIAKRLNLELKNLDLTISTDKKWLAFIIEQIILNSIKYTGENGTIMISGKTLENGKYIVIEDNGIGIKEEDLGRVFDKGFTGYNGRENLKATGIGLYLSKKLAIKLGHDITIESVYSKYTRVTIYFPKLSEYYKLI